MEFLLSYVKILKDDFVKVLHSICQQVWKTQQWPQDWKRSIFIPIPKKGNTKECSNYHTIVLISRASKIRLKVLQARLQLYVNQELSDIQVGLEEAEEPEICWLTKKARAFQKNICFIHMLKLLHESQQTVENSSRDGNIRPPYLPPKKPVCS